MGRQKGVSITNQKIALAKRQASLENVESKRELNKILKYNPHLNGVCVNHVKNLGYTAEAGEG